MSEDKEKISAWLDDAIEHDELYSLRVDQEQQSLSTAARYQMIGDALRGRVSDASMIDIGASVREAIEQEPVPLAKPVVARRPERKPLFDFGAWLKPAGGLAVAATVAMVMVVTLTDQQMATDSAVVANVGQQPVQSVPVSNTAPVYGQPNLAIPAVNLNSYVTQHSEFAAQDTIQGMMPYARSVSYGLENDPTSQNNLDRRQNVNHPGK